MCLSPELKRTPKMIDHVGGEQGVLVLGGDGEISSEAVEVDGGFYSKARIISGMDTVLTQHRCDDAGEDVATAAFGQSRIARGVDGEAAVRMSNDRAPAFQDQDDLVMRGKVAGDCFAVGLDLLDALVDQPSHFAGMWRENHNAVGTVQ